MLVTCCGVRNEKVIQFQASIKDYKSDRIYRIFRIFFAFPEERQKVIILFEKTDWANTGKGLTSRWKGLEADFSFTAFRRDCAFSVSSGD